jgi:hypothetical protein
VVRLERELNTLAAQFDRWWYDTQGDYATDLTVGARLHQEIVTRLDRLMAVRREVANATAARGPSEVPSGATTEAAPRPPGGAGHSAA